MLRIQFETYHGGVGGIIHGYSTDIFRGVFVNFVNTVVFSLRNVRYHITIAFALLAVMAEQAILSEENNKVIIPTWAEESGQDIYGLWASITILGEKYKFRFCPGGQYKIRNVRYDRSGTEYENTIFGSDVAAYNVAVRPFWIGSCPITQDIWRKVTSTDEYAQYYKGMELGDIYVRDANILHIYKDFNNEKERDYFLNGDYPITYVGPQLIAGFIWYVSSEKFKKSKNPLRLPTPEEWIISAIGINAKNEQVDSLDKTMNHLKYKPDSLRMRQRVVRGYQKSTKIQSPDNFRRHSLKN